MMDLPGKSNLTESTVSSEEVSGMGAICPPERTFAGGISGRWVSCRAWILEDLARWGAREKCSEILGPMNQLIQKLSPVRAALGLQLRWGTLGNWVLRQKPGQALG